MNSYYTLGDIDIGGEEVYVRQHEPSRAPDILKTNMAQDSGIWRIPMLSQQSRCAVSKLGQEVLSKNLWQELFTQELFLGKWNVIGKSFSNIVL